MARTDRAKDSMSGCSPPGELDRLLGHLGVVVHGGQHRQRLRHLERVGKTSGDLSPFLGGPYRPGPVAAGGGDRGEHGQRPAQRPLADEPPGRPRAASTARFPSSAARSYWARCRAVHAAEASASGRAGWCSPPGISAASRASQPNGVPTRYPVMARPPTMRRAGSASPAPIDQSRARRRFSISMSTRSLQSASSAPHNPSPACAENAAKWVA